MLDDLSRNPRAATELRRGHRCHQVGWALALVAGLVTAAGAAPARGGKVDATIAALQQGDAKARCKAAQTLGTAKDEATLAALAAALDTRDEAVRDCVQAALRRRPDATAWFLRAIERQDAALQAAPTTDRGAVEAATRALGTLLRQAGVLGDVGLLPAIDRGLLPRQPRFVRSGAAWCLSHLAVDDATQARWQVALGDADKDVRWPLADGLARAARGAAGAGQARAVALARARLAVEKDAGVRARLEAAAR